MHVDGEFVDVLEVVGDASIELRYAGTRHPFGAPMYALNRAFLRKGTAVALARAQALIKHTGLRLKIWDAYRPLGVQAAMWRAVADPAFIAPPSRGSHHNRGAAVDVTLVDVFGADVEMPTDFDDFTPAARSDALCSATAATNQEILRRAMLSAGFRGISTEWWHFVDPFWRAYPLCDVTLHQLATLRCSWR